MSHFEPAFPGVELNGNGDLYDSWPGMTLRDYFAAKAMAAIYGANNLDFYEKLATRRDTASENEIAKKAYRISDAMLLVRDKK